MHASIQAKVDNTQVDREFERRTFSGFIPHGPVFVALDSNGQITGFKPIEVFTTLGALRALRELGSACPSGHVIVPAFCETAQVGRDQSDVRLYAGNRQSAWWNDLLRWGEDARAKRSETQPG